MNELEVNIYEKNYKRAQILVDGQDLLWLLGAEKFFIDMTPRDLYESLTKDADFIDYFNGQLEEEDEDKTILFSCNCSELLCGSIFVEMFEKEDSIVWKNFKSAIGVEYDFMENIEFTKVNYEKVLMDLLA